MEPERRMTTRATPVLAEGEDGLPRPVGDGGYDDIRHAAGVSPSEDRGAIGVEEIAIEMTMRIDHAAARASSR